MIALKLSLLPTGCSILNLPCLDQRKNFAIIFWQIDELLGTCLFQVTTPVNGC